MSIALTKYVKSQHQTKHTNVQHYYIKELVNKKKLIIKQISISKMVVDKIIIILPSETFRKY